ncbi:MAG: midcut-by-XrtH protein [Azoarcus sp.]|nr:midcut-by-XrtH protein [Azoarcus sp.]
MKTTNWTKRSVVAAALTLLPGLAAAQEVTITYGPIEPTAVPTLSQWGMIGMSVLIALAAYATLRRTGGARFLLALGVCAAGLLGAEGYRIVGTARAVPAPVMDQPQGGTLVFPAPSFSSMPVENTTSVPLQILSISPDLYAQAPGTTCDPGVIVAPGGTCDVSAPPP